MPERRAFSVSIFARHSGRVLLIKHRRLDAWLPTGGEIESGETPLEAARRELFEETGLRGRFERAGGVDGAPPGLLGYEEHAAGSKGLHMNFAFVADVDLDRVVANDEFGDHRWIADLGELGKLAAPRNVRELAALALDADADADAGAGAGTGARTGAGDNVGVEDPRADATDVASLTNLARAWLAAFNERALERLLALYADDAVHYSPKLRARRPETEGRVRGKAALREWWADSFARLPVLHYAERAITASRGGDGGGGGDALGGRIVLEYDRTLPGEATLAVAECFVVRGGAIAESRVYHG